MRSNALLIVFLFNLTWVITPCIALFSPSCHLAPTKRRRLRGVTRSSIVERDNNVLFCVGYNTRRIMVVKERRLLGAGVVHPKGCHLVPCCA
jgi:hypothetical protein